MSTNSPFIRNAAPSSNETGVDGDAVISFDILDDLSGVDLSATTVYINGTQVFSGPDTFISPWNGSGSNVLPTVVDGYSGYHVTIDGTTQMSTRTSYTIRVVTRDLNLNALDQSWKFDTGSSIDSVLVGDYETNLIVTFAEDMDYNATSIVNPANYVFNNGMYARNAFQIDSKNVLLEVELFHTNTDFELTVGSNILDSYGDPIPPSYNGKTFSPFQSDANIGNFNAKIRTWHASNVILADRERIYVAGSRGIDVFRKESGVNPVRWAQILDEYGVSAMYVANYPNELVITDSLPPEISNLNPLPNTTNPAVGTIGLTVADLNTAVEPTSVTIYVNGLSVFRGGYGGWSNDYSGRLDVSDKELNFTLIPPSPFVFGQVVVVRVVATDLLGNMLDQTYQFSIGTSAITVGWGGESWGSFNGYGGTLYAWGGETV